MKQRLYEILRNPKEFLQDGEKLTLEKDGAKIVMHNEGEILSIYGTKMEPELGDEYFIGNCLYHVTHVAEGYAVLEDLAGNRLPPMSFNYLSKYTKATYEEKVKRNHI